MYEANDKIENKLITISLKEKKLSEILDSLISNKNLKWSIKDNIIRIQETSETALHVDFISTSIFSPPISGVVRGSDGQPIAGVNVVVKGTKKGIVTDAYGRFSIEAEQGKTLVISEYWI